MSRIFGLRSNPTHSKPTLTDSFLNDLILKKKQSIHKKFLQFADSDDAVVIRRSALESYLEEECGLDTGYEHLRELLDYYCTLGGGMQHETMSGGMHVVGGATVGTDDMEDEGAGVSAADGGHQEDDSARIRPDSRLDAFSTTSGSPQQQQMQRSESPDSSTTQQQQHDSNHLNPNDYYQSSHNFSTDVSPSTQPTMFSPSPQDLNRTNASVSGDSSEHQQSVADHHTTPASPPDQHHRSDPRTPKSPSQHHQYHPNHHHTRQQHNTHLHHQFHHDLEHKEMHSLDTLNLYQFTKLLTDKNVIQKAIDHELAIPHFGEFVEDVIKICEETEKVQDGKVPTYIPELKNVDPQDFAVSICTVDGQQFSYGDSDVEFTLQAAVLPLVYCLALEQHGKKVKDHIGREPSGARFNDFVLTEDNKPHNSLVSTGGILTCSLIEPKEPSRASERYGKVNSLLLAMSASKQISFNQRVYLSEKSHSDRNAALAYYMRGQGVAGMQGNNIADILDFYYQCCSIATTTKVLAQCGSTLANGGINCFTQKRVLKSSTVRQTLSIMYTCGLADSSGEWAFQVGLPAKSGIAGGMLIVVPNVCGIAVYSPRVNEGGHSVRAIDFSKRLVSKFSFSIFDQLVDGIVTSKSDPTVAHES